jgi:hypothetical protein
LLKLRAKREQAARDAEAKRAADLLTLRAKREAEQATKKMAVLEDVRNRHNFTGKWDAVSGRGIHYDMQLTQKRDNTVEGTYKPLNGKITGTVKDKTLTFTWTETDKGKTTRGNGTLTLDSDDAFTGTWYVVRPPSNGTWTGTRVKTP